MARDVEKWSSNKNHVFVQIKSSWEFSLNPISVQFSLISMNTNTITSSLAIGSMILFEPVLFEILFYIAIDAGLAPQ